MFDKILKSKKVAIVACILAVAVISTASVLIATGQIGIWKEDKYPVSNEDGYIVRYLISPTGDEISVATAVSIAQETIPNSDVEEVQLTKDLWDREVFEVFLTKEVRTYRVLIDAFCGDVLMYDYNSSEEYNIESEPKISPKEAKEIAYSFFNETYGEFIPTGNFTIEINVELREMSYDVSFDRYLNGVPILGDCAFVAVDKISGDVTYSGNHLGLLKEEIDTTPLINETEATNIVRNQYPNRTAILHVTKWITVYGDSGVLVWWVSAAPPEDLPSAISIFVDAKTGEILES